MRRAHRHDAVHDVDPALAGTPNLDRAKKADLHGAHVPAVDDALTGLTEEERAEVEEVEEVEEEPSPEPEPEPEPEPLPDGLVEGDNGWYTASDGKNVHGRDAAVEYQNSLT